MAETDLQTREDEDALREDGAELDEDNRLKPEFVRSVVEALEDGDAAEEVIEHDAAVIRFAVNR